MDSTLRRRLASLLILYPVIQINILKSVYTKVAFFKNKLFYRSNTDKNKFSRELIFANFFFGHFAGINFRKLGYTEDFAGINFRKLSLTKDFAGVNFHDSAFYKDFAGVNLTFVSRNIFPRS